ncbi:MAG: HEAT repeat domain-containing protein [Planctomycetota bacterium]|jgi:hypothetical protein
MSPRSRVLLVCAATLFLVAAGAPCDLDVDIPSDSPFEYIKIPNQTPTESIRKSTQTQAAKKRARQKATGKPHETVAEGAKVAEDPPPPPPPSALGNVRAPSTADYQQHLNWQPKGGMVKWVPPPTPGQPPARDPTPTGRKGPVEDPARDPKKKDPKKDAGIWDVQNYPPAVPNDMYVYTITQFLLVMLHRPQICEPEITQYLIEMGYPAYYGATACEHQGEIKNMTRKVLDCVGPMIENPPAKPEGETRQRVYMDLIAKYPYQPGFASWILRESSGKTLPELLHIVKNEKHPFVLRNAVFLLRCYNNPEVVAPLRELLMKTKDPVIRNRALAALVRWRDPETAEWCGKMVKARDSFRNYAAWAIGRIGAPSQIKNLIAAAKASDAHGDFLLSAIPALGRCGDMADEKRRKRAEKFLISLLAIVPNIPDPPRWPHMEGLLRPIRPDPPNIRRRILRERVNIALARIGRESEEKWVKKLGFQTPSYEGAIHITNCGFFNETLERIMEREKLKQDAGDDDE